MATEETWTEILRTNHADLLLLIDTDSGLEGEVKRMKLFTSLQHKRIWELKDNTIRRNEELLRFIRIGDFDRFQAFREALLNSGQKPVVTRHLSEVKTQWSSCVQSEDPRSSMSLKESYRDRLREKWNHVLEKIVNCQEIIVQLGSRKSLTPFQQTRLQDFKYDFDKTSFLLKLLENGSEKLFADFCDVLKSVNKLDLIETLTPSEAQLALDDIETTFHKVELLPTSDDERRRIRNEIESEMAYSVSNGAVKGRVLVFSNRYFIDLAERNGTEYDEANLVDFFRTKLKFKTDVHADLTSQQMREKLEDEAINKDLTNVDVFIVFILSHGIDGEIYGLDGKTLRTDDIFQLLDGERCPKLAGKPKLFFIQACRIVGSSNGTSSARTDAVPEMEKLTLNDPDPEVAANLEKLKSEDDPPSRPYHPRADMAVFQATVRGDFAYREEEGSFFVRHLLDVFTKKVHSADVVSMTTEARERVHRLHGRKLGEETSTLLRKVYLMA